MLNNQLSIPSVVTEALKEEGYHYDQTMQPTALVWWEWYTATHNWYDKTEWRDGHRFKVKRQTLHPARRVCREWASSILDDDGTKLGTDSDEVTELLEKWATETRFVSTAQRALERAFGVGTAALSLWFDTRGDDGVDIKLLRYDARSILPLSWDDNGISECAFVSRTYIDGKECHELQTHVLGERGTYVIRTRIFESESSEEIFPDWLLPEFDTGVDTPPFAIIRPALDNVYAEGTYMGQSIFADAVDAIKGVDNAFDSMQREIDATKVKVFMSAFLFDMERSEDGTVSPIPMSPEETIIMKVDSVATDTMYEVFSPPIRTQELADALNVALAELGDLTGFGQDYFRYDKAGGLRTATEVSASNSAFMRNIRKHENDLKPQLERFLACMLACQRLFNAWPVPEECEVHVDFDDSIIQDTDSEKARMLAEVSAGIVPKWMYLVRFYAMSEEEAKAMAEPEPEVLDIGA